MTTAKQIHSIVTKQTFKNNLNVQQTYREIYNELGIAKEGKKSRLSKVMSSGLLGDFLTKLFDIAPNKLMIEPKGFERIKIDGHRKYKFDNTFYPSVTTVLRHGKTDSFDFVTKWKESLIAAHGLKKAERKMELSTKIGNYTHASIEHYLMSGLKDRTLIDNSLGKHLHPFLDGIETVMAVELPVYSKRGYAGMIDCVAKLKDGSTVIIDWKTKNKAANKSNSKDYFVQASAYALALYDMYGIKVDKIILAYMYKSTIGVRKPARHRIIETTDVRSYLNIFLERLDNYKALVDTDEDELEYMF